MKLALPLYGGGSSRSRVSPRVGVSSCCVVFGGQEGAPAFSSAATAVGGLAFESPHGREAHSVSTFFYC